MNGIRPDLGVKFDDNYMDAKKKLIDFARVFDLLNQAQKQQLLNECFSAVCISASFDEFTKQMNNGGSC